LRGREASETAPDDDNPFVRHERKPETDYVLERNLSTFWGLDTAGRTTVNIPYFFIRLPTYIAYHLGHAVGVFLLISDGSKQTSN